MTDVRPPVAPSTGPPPTPSKTPQPILWLAVALVAGTLVGLLVGFLLFKTSSKSVAVTAPTPTPLSPTATASPIPTPTPTATSVPATPTTTAPPTSAPASAGRLTDSTFSGCPAPAPGQHTLAPVAGPTAAGATANPANSWYGCGNTVTPSDTPGFTGANWELAYSFSCPDSDAPGGAPGVPGMYIESWVYAGGGAPVHNTANDVTADLPWSDNVHSSVPQGGDYRLRTRLVNGATGDNRCRWHIRAYTTPP